MSPHQEWKSVFTSDVCGHVYLQERRKEFEANLEKAGLELETEDKSVRNVETAPPTAYPSEAQGRPQKRS